MAKVNKYRRAKASDFFDYFDGKMSEEDRNAFERQIQKEIFNEEASDGFAMISREDAEKDLEFISNKIRRRIKRKQRVIWYGAAAALASILVVTTIFFNINDRDRFEAMPEMKEAAKEQASAVNKEDTPMKADQDKGSKQEKAEKIQTQQAQEELENPKQHAASGTEGADRFSTGEVSPSAEANESAANDQAEDVNVNAFYIQDEEIPADEIDNTQTVADQGVSEIKGSGVENYTAGDVEEVNIRAAAKSVGRTETQEVSKPLNSQEKKELIAADENEGENILEVENPAEQALVNNVSAKNKSAAPSTPAVIVNYSASDYQSAVPEAGIPAYKSYIDSVLIFPKENYNLETADVKLRFLVSISGRPTEFQVVQAPSSAFANEAIRVIQNGPAWSPAKNSGVAVVDTINMTIVFGEQHKREE